MSTLHSSRWHQVATLRPALSPLLAVRRQRVRGQPWFVYAGVPGQRPVRLNPAAHALAGRLDGTRSVQQLWEGVVAQEGGEPPTQDEVIELLAQLGEVGLVDLGAGAGTTTRPSARSAPHEVSGARRWWAWRLLLGNPMPLLQRLRPLLPLLFHPLAHAAWLLVVLGLAAELLQQAPELMDHGRQWLATPRYALLAALLYVPLKALHELAHAAAVVHGGGTVPRWGVTIMFGLPMPWVDASAAAAFPRKRDRLRVGAAGMAAELAVAAAALTLWQQLPDGWGRDTAFVVLVLAGVSTIVFNANPLQRLDGYHLLVDLAGLPNLATRSRAWWRQALVARLRGWRHEEPMALATGERPWLVAYAPLAWVWGIGIVAATAAWATALSPWLGIVVLLCMGTATVLAPAWRFARELRRAASAEAASTRRWRGALAIGALAALGLLGLPLPRTLTVTGVVWPPDDAQLRAQEAGFVQSIDVRDGELVEAGQVVARLANPALAVALQRQQAQVSALEAELVQATGGDQAGGDARVGDRHAVLAQARAELQRLQERSAALSLRAGTRGRVGWPQPADLMHSWVPQGQLLGQVQGDHGATVRIALPQDEADELAATPAVSVRLATQRGQAHAGTLLRDARAATGQLPTAALSDVNGGPVVTDPADERHLKPLRPVVLVDMRLDALPQPARLGERALVRFEAASQPLAWRALRHAMRVIEGRA